MQDLHITSATEHLDLEEANPQCEDGYTRIANELLDAICCANFSAYESRVFWYVVRKTYGFRKKTDQIALSQFSKDIGIDRRNIHRALKQLKTRKIIVIHSDDRIAASYQIQKNYKLWDLSSIPMTCHPYRRQICHPSRANRKNLSSIRTPTKENKNTKEIKERNTISANLSSTEMTDSPETFLISRKKRKICGKRLETFLQFWEAFNYKKGRAEAIDSWIDIPELTYSLVGVIVEKAKAEAKRRPSLISEGRTPKMAQGWLTARRWEDEDPVKEESRLAKLMREQEAENGNSPAD